MPSLIDELRSSPTLRRPSASEKSWFELESRSTVGTILSAADFRAGAAGHNRRPRAAALAIVLRDFSGGSEASRAEMLLIKRAVNSR